MKKVLWTSEQLAAAAHSTAKGNFAATGVSINTRTLNAGDVFFALKGSHADGHDFVADALQKGAVGAVINREVPGVDKFILAKDVFEVLCNAGRMARKRARAKIIAVTGSAGKTGCKEALAQVLPEQAETFANEGSYNNYLGVPLSLARMPPDVKYGVFEIGMNRPGELGPLSREVQPYIALITNIAAVHIGNFANLDEIAAAKAEIFEGMDANGVAVLNADDAYHSFLQNAAKARGIKNIHGFGKAANASARMIEMNLGADDSHVKAEVLGKKLHYKVAAPGEHWVMNSLAVLLTAGLAGADIEKAADALIRLKLAKGRGVPQKISIADGSFTLIDESYNASPVATEMAIRVLGGKQPEGNGRRLLALGDMRELGAQSRLLHESLAPAIAKAGIALLFCCGEYMKVLYDSLPEQQRGVWRATSAELAPVVAGEIRAGDIVTIKGSKTTEMDKVVDALTALAINGNATPKHATG